MKIAFGPDHAGLLDKIHDVMSSRYFYSLLAGLGTSGAVYLVETSLARAGMRAESTFLDDALLGIFAAVGLFFLLQLRDRERELSRQKQYASVIANLNHHIRNALQVIVYRAELNVQGNPELQDIRNAVNRIDWALREIHPHSAELGPEPAKQGKLAASLSEPPIPQIAPDKDQRSGSHGRA